MFGLVCLIFGYSDLEILGASEMRGVVVVFLGVVMITHNFLLHLFLFSCCGLWYFTSRNRFALPLRYTAPEIQAFLPFSLACPTSSSIFVARTVHIPARCPE